MDEGHAGDGLPDRDAKHGQQAEVLERAALTLARVPRGVAGDVGEATHDPDEAGGGGEARVVKAGVEEARFCSESVSEHESAVKPEWASSAWFTHAVRKTGRFSMVL